jgi:hypothetical protein
LISDALRKARRESAGRLHRTARLAVSESLSPPVRSRLGSGLVIGAVIALIAAGAGAGLVWWLVRGGTEGVERATESASEAATREAMADRRSRISLATPIAPDLEPSGDSRGEVVHRRPLDEVSRNPQPTSLPEAPRRSDRLDIGTEHDTRGETSTGPATDGPATAGRDFVVDADVGYARLSLDYIVFRGVDPFAEINGIEVHVGSEVVGFVVREIARDRVVLEDERGPLTLRVR